MKQQRHLLYEVPHKGIRNALSQLSLIAGNTDYNDKTEVEKLKDLAGQIFRLLETHSDHENNVPLKYLEQKISGGSVHDKDDHLKIESEMRDLDETLKELYERSGKGEDLKYPGNDFYLKVTDFHSRYLQHMLEEERETQILLWENFTGEELLKQEAEIRSSISPQDMLLWAKFIMPAFTNSKRIELLKMIRQAAPPEFYNAVMGITGSVLPADVFNKLKNEL